jgi:hypothetical protein
MKKIGLSARARSADPDKDAPNKTSDPEWIHTVQAATLAE